MIQLTIQMDETGHVSVNGPIGNKLLCYGMLELARDAIKAFADKQQQEQPRIMMPTNGDVRAIARRP